MTGLSAFSRPAQGIVGALFPVFLAGAAATPSFGQDDGCTLVATPVSFCGQPAVWQPFDAPTGDADATFLGPDGVLSQIFVDDVGAQDGVTIETYLAEILSEQRLANTGGTFEVLGHAVEMVDGQEGRSLLLGVEKDGRRALFMVTVMVLPGQTVRLLTIAERGETLTPKAELHVAFLSGIRIGQADG